MIARIIFDEELIIPSGIDSLQSFTKWVHSSDFPETGRIDYYQGSLEIEMSPESMYTHGTPKTEIARVLSTLVKDRDLGDVFIDRMRIQFPEIDFSCEPDLCFVSNASLAAGRFRRIAGRQQRFDKFIEIQGPPDLVVEIVSDSSVTKDLKKLPLRYFDGGVQEYWVVDARREELIFRIYTRGRQAFTKARVDKDGFARSKVFGHEFRLLRTAAANERWRYDLHFQ